MSVLVIEVPEQPERIVELASHPLVLGRTSASDIVLADETVSARHLRIAPLEGGDALATDLDSTHGTRLGKRRIRRALLQPGDALALGRSRVRFLAAAPAVDAAPPESLVGGTLGLKPVAAPSPAPLPDVPPPEAPREAPPALPSPASNGSAPSLPRPVRPIDARAMGRAIAFALLALAVLGGVRFLLHPAAERARSEAASKRALRSVLETADISSEALAQDVAAYLRSHPRSPEGEALSRYLVAVREHEARRQAALSELRSLTTGLHDLAVSDVRGRLLELQRTLSGDEDVVEQARLALADLDRRHEEEEAEALTSLLADSNARIQAGDPAAALRRLSAFRTAWPALAPEALSRLGAAENGAIAAADALAAKALADAEKAPDDLTRRRVLAAAYRGLAGTPQGERVADALRFTRTPAAATPAPGPGASTPQTPGAKEPGPGTEVLARAAAAEDLVRQRHWAKARAALQALIAGARPGLLRDEWVAREGEVRRILDLVSALDHAAKSDAPPRPRLSLGRARVLGATPEGVDLELDGKTKHVAWNDLGDDDLLRVLSPHKPTVDERLGIAVLDAGLGRRDELVKTLVPLFEKGTPPEEVSRFVARNLFGRSEPPPGGYRVYAGTIVDQTGYERALRAERVEALGTKAGQLLAKVVADPAFRKLEKLANLRAELDRRRQYALLAIFDEKHYPYPYDRGSQQYQAVQKEVDRRVAAVREIWDDTTKVKIARKGSLGHLLDEWDATLGELRKLGEDTSELEAKIAPYLAYVTNEPITVHEYFRNAAEQKLFAYNRWVMAVYNPAQTATATDAEREQTRITNEYRMMMGYAGVVTPGPAPYEAVTDDTVAKIIDQGRLDVAHLVPLRAVRIDDRLVRSAREHSLDMQRRGYFSHYAPPNPETGEPRTSPFDRMQKAGYHLSGGSENIAGGATSPQQAHDQWCHSSGHHRNILSPWHDQGVGQAGRLWTQNFGVGGGAPPEIPAQDAGTKAPDAPGGAPPRAGAKPPRHR